MDLALWAVVGLLGAVVCWLIAQNIQLKREVECVRAFVAQAHPDKLKKIYLVRHGQSEGNVNLEIYKTKPDNALLLTPTGKLMAIEAGKAIRDSILSDPVMAKNTPNINLWVSPFLRTRETAVGILQGLGDLRKQVMVRESILLVEQDWGMFEGIGRSKAKEMYPIEYERLERMKLGKGKFWARVPLGESCFDVCQRLLILFGSFHRDKFAEVSIVVSHGITIRSFVMMWCHRTPEWFETSENPPNCSVRLIEPTKSNFAADRGYVFGGYNDDTPLDKPLSVEDENKRICAEIESVMQSEEFIARWLQTDLSQLTHPAPPSPNTPNTKKAATIGAWIHRRHHHKRE